MRAQMSGPYHGGYGGPGSVNPRPEPVENPGLDATKHTYVGTLKRRMNTKHGYTFIVSEEISTAFPAKDAYLHATACPWVEYMELDQDDVVSFNVEDKNGSPQVVRIVKGKP
jgi:cold shock CspA family protein